MPVITPALFDSYSGDHVARVLDAFEEGAREALRARPDGPYEKGRLDTVVELRRILSEARYDG